MRGHRAARSARGRTAAVAAAVVLVVAGCSDDPSRPPQRNPRSTQSSSAGTAPALTDVTFSEVARAEEPVALVGVPGTELVLVAERRGRVLAFEATDAGLAAAGNGPALDLTDVVISDAPEQGLLGLAVDAEAQWLYVDYIAAGGDAGTTTVQRFPLDGTTVDRDGAETIFEVRQPFANHNGGSLVIGPDRALYVGMGDGGSQGDPENRAQRLDGRFGRILRFALDGSPPTTWAMGLRNPWRFSIDGPTGDLWIGDVGGSEREEVDRVEGRGPGTIAGRGANFGWSRREGFVVPGDDEGDPGGPSDFVDPVYDYSHDDGGCSVVGGHVARGGDVAAIEGLYLFGDYCLGTVWTLDPTGYSVTRLGAVTDLSSFGTDAAGRSYALSLGGAIFRLEAA